MLDLDIETVNADEVLSKWPTMNTHCHNRRDSYYMCVVHMNILYYDKKN